jgi:hypothetical protein
VSALEQAEQMFRAATVVGAATQPLLLFYGLSQAGRAIAAASCVDHNAWQLMGHGISCQDLTGDLRNVKIRTEKPGKASSFVRLSEILGSPLWNEPVSLQKLWETIPSNHEWPLSQDEQSSRMPLLAVPDFYGIESHPLLTVAVCYFPSWVVHSSQPSDDLALYLADFPGIDGYDSYQRLGREVNSAPKFNFHTDGRGELNINWYANEHQSSRIAERQEFLNNMTHLYQGQRWFFPDVTSARKPLHPLMAWWTVLYTLSMLARYHPAEWVQHIDVDSSPLAVTLERVLNSAIHIVPSIIMETMNEVTASDR